MQKLKMAGESESMEAPLLAITDALDQSPESTLRDRIEHEVHRIAEEPDPKPKGATLACLNTYFT